MRPISTSSPTDNVQELPRVYLKTLEPIKTGDELLASYGRQYWDNSRHLASSSEEEQGEPDAAAGGLVERTADHGHGMDKRGGDDERGAPPSGSRLDVIDVDSWVSH